MSIGYRGHNHVRGYVWMFRRDDLWIVNFMVAVGPSPILFDTTGYSERTWTDFMYRARAGVTTVEHMLIAGHKIDPYPEWAVEWPPAIRRKRSV